MKKFLMMLLVIAITLLVMGVTGCDLMGAAADDAIFAAEKKKTKHTQHKQGDSNHQ